MEAETLEQAQARHRRELKDLQGRITNKKKNATKKTRKGVSDECADLERQLREQHAAQLSVLRGDLLPNGADAPHPDLADSWTAGGRATDAARASTPPQHDPPTTATEEEELAAATEEKLRLQSDAPAKKRNRQKERLARRAAEQEAAARDAEAEAAGMTDHRRRESEYMKKAMRAHNLHEVDITPDGHCLFSAVADQLAHSAIALEPGPGGPPAAGEPAYRTVRRVAAAYMAQHAEVFAPFLEEPLEAYVAKMRDTAEWGGQLELLALARRYGVAISVLQDGRTEMVDGLDGQEEDGGRRRRLWLAYYRHGYGLGEHYNSLRRKAAVS